MIRLALKILTFLGISLSLYSQISINEICASNGGTYYDFENKTPDWIELKNTSDEDINLKDWRIGVKNDFNSGYKLPDTLVKAGEFLMIHCSKKNMDEEYTIVSTKNNEIAAYRYYDSFDFYFSEFSEDFSIQLNIRAMKHYNQYGVAGLMLRNNLEHKSNFLGVFARNKQLFKFAFMKRDTLGQDPKFWQSEYGLNYPDAFLKVNRKDDSISVAIADKFGYEIEKHTIWYPVNQKIYAGFAIAAMEGNFSTQAVIGDLLINNQKFDFANLKFEPVFRKGRKADFRKTKEIHTNFKLNSNVDSIKIWDSNMNLIELVYAPIISRPDFSVGNLQGVPIYYDNPSPEAENSNGFTKLMDKPITFLKSGYYKSPQTLQLTHVDINSDIYYSLDGSDISVESSLKYNGEAIKIEKNTVLKARAYGIDAYPSELLQCSFFIEEESNLPSISLIIDSLNLFGEFGIFDERNYYAKIEQPAFFEVFDKEKQVYSTNMGIQLTGESSMFLPQKSVRFYARDKYGSDEFSYNFFNKKNFNAYEKLWLRSASNDWSSTLLRDVYTNVLAELYTVLSPPKYKPINLYINGNYWGIYNLKEFIDEDFLGVEHDINQNYINLLERDDIIKNGTPRTFEELFKFVEKTNFSDSSQIEIIEKLIDVDNLIDYVSLQNFSANVDWGSVNIKFWQSEELDGKWRWIMHDLDQTFPVDIGPAINILENLYNSNSRIGIIFRNFSENIIFRNRFINRTADLLNTGLRNSNTINIFDSLANLIKNDIPKHKARWENSAINFDNECLRLKDFLHHRNNFIYAQFIDLYKLQGTYEVHIENSDTTNGYVQINSITIKDSDWTGVYFKDVPISIKAVPKPGFTFVGWESENLENLEEIEINPEIDIEVKPIFVEETNTNHKIVINEIMYKPLDSKDSKDWFELYNYGESDIIISNWYFTDDNIKNKFVIPEKTTINAGEFLVFAENLSKFKEIYPNVSNVIGGFGFGLSASGDKLELFDSEGNQIDLVEFLPSSPWDSNANGTGFSLELIDKNSDNNVGANWRASLESLGTPGRKNSTEGSNQLSEFFNNAEIFPNPASNSIHINLKSNISQFVSINIIDNLGNTIQNLFENYNLIEGENNLHFNLSLSSGKYFVVITNKLNNQIIHSIPLLIRQ